MHGSKIIFVAGTDTQVGKSVVSGLLAGFLVGRGYKAITQKWVQSGGSKYADLGLHLKLAGIKKNQIKDDIDLVVPYHFKFPGSPHLSSKLENIRIKKGKIKDKSKGLILDIKPLPNVMKKLLEDGGVVEHFKKHGGFKF